MNSGEVSRQRRVGVGHVALTLPLVAAVIAARLPVRDNSYLWHVRAGTAQIDSGSVLTTDPFSFTAAGADWRTQSWIMDLLYGWGDRLWGLELVTPLVVIGASLLMTAIALRVFNAVSKPLPAAIGVVWVMWLVIGYFTPRPVLFSLVLLAVFLLAADAPGSRWTLPFLMWLWAGVHGGFIVGLGYLVLDGLRRRDRSRLYDLISCTAVTFLTAHGWGTWEVVLDFLGNSKSLDLISEWLTPDFISLALFPFAIGLATMLAMAASGRIGRADLWVIVPFMLFALTANRAVPIASLVLAPWLVLPLRSWKLSGATADRRQTVLNAGIVLTVLLGPWLVPLKGGLDQSLFAVNALRFVGPGRLFHDDAVGGYLIYSEWPERQVFIDDRAELYGDTFHEFVQARGGSTEWEDTFDDYQIHQALLKTEDPLAEILEATGWIATYRDKEFVLFIEPE